MRLCLVAGLLIFLSFEALAAEKNRPDDIYVSEEVGKNGKRYFIQYRKLGDDDTSTYVNVRRKVLKNTEEQQKNEDDDNVYDKTRPGLLRMKKKYLRHEMPNKIIDDQWNYNMNKSQYDAPELAYELFNLMEKNDKKNLYNATVIKCLFDLEYDWTGNNSFDFDVSTILEDNLEISDAELHVYRIPTEENENKNQKKNQNTKKEDHLVRLFQKMPVDVENENSTTLDVHKLLSVRYYSSTYKGWQTFKVKGALDGWFSGENNLGLILESLNSKDKNVDVNYGTKEFMQGQYAPILTVYLKRTTEDDEETQEEVKEENFIKKKIAPLSQLMSRYINGQIPCSRHIWYVNFEDIAWDNFILAPRGYMAYRCKGSCSIPSLTDHSNHGRIMSIYESFDENITGPRCSPTLFKPLTLMFYDKYGNIVIKSYADMIVEKCGCR